MKINKSIFLIFASVFVLFSCSNGNNTLDKKAYITIGSVDLADKVSSKNARTIQQEDASDLTDFELKGTLNGTETSLVSATTYSILTTSRIQVEEGNWTFVLTAKNGSVNYTGEVDKEITSDGDNSISFVMTSDAQYGGLSIKMTFSGRANKVVVNLMNGSDHEDVKDNAEFETFEGTTTSKYFTYTRDVNSSNKLTAGTYYITFDFYNTLVSTSVPLNTGCYYVRVGNNQNTTAELTLELNGVYEINYNKDGGTLVTGETQVNTYSRKSSFTLPLLEKTGYTFEGWYDDEEGTGTKYTEIPEGTTGDLDLYAKWLEETQSVDIDVSLGNHDFSNITVTKEVTGTIVKLTAKEGENGSDLGGEYSLTWAVDGSALADTSNPVEIQTDGWAPGVYDLTLRASKTENGSTVTQTWAGQYTVN